MKNPEPDGPPSERRILSGVLMSDRLRDSLLVPVRKRIADEVEKSVARIRFIYTAGGEISFDFDMPKEATYLDWLTLALAERYFGQSNEDKPGCMAAGNRTSQ